jgi:hypothetical protein
MDDSEERDCIQMLVQLDDHMFLSDTETWARG